MNFKVGDRVRIKSTLDINQDFRGLEAKVTQLATEVSFMKLTVFKFNGNHTLENISSSSDCLELVVTPMQEYFEKVKPTSL